MITCWVILTDSFIYINHIKHTNKIDGFLALIVRAYEEPYKGLTVRHDRKEIVAVDKLITHIRN